MKLAAAHRFVLCRLATKWLLNAEQKRCLVPQQEAFGDLACYPMAASMQGSTKPLHAWQPWGLCPASTHSVYWVHIPCSQPAKPYQPLAVSTYVCPQSNPYKYPGQLARESNCKASTGILSKIARNRLVNVLNCQDAQGRSREHRHTAERSQTTHNARLHPLATS